MLSKTAIALTATASLAIGAATFTPFAQVEEHHGFISINYPACVEDPSGTDCQKAQEGSRQSHGGNAAMHEHRGAY